MSNWLAESYIGEDENNDKSAEEILASVLASRADDNLTGFAFRVGFTAHVVIPREGELDYLAEAAFVPPQLKKNSKPKKAKTPAPVKGAPQDGEKPTAAVSPKKTKKAA